MSPTCNVHRHGITLALLLAAGAAPVLGQVTSSGAVSPAGLAGDAVNVFVPVLVGLAGPGSLAVQAGSVLAAPVLTVGANAGGFGQLLVDGGTPLSASSVQLGGDGLATRLVIGQTGRGEVFVSGGGQINAGGAGPGGACGASACGALIGQGAGSSGLLQVSGSNSNVLIQGTLAMAAPLVLTAAADGVSLGTPGGITLAQLNVLDGGVLQSGNGLLGSAPSGSGLNGSEQSRARVLIDGPGAAWILSQPAGAALPFLRTALHASSPAEITVRNRGLLRLDGGTLATPDGYTTMQLSDGTGQTLLTVTGAGSKAEVLGASPLINVGRRAGGSATVQVLDGATLSSQMLMIGRDGGRGQVIVSGAGSTLTLAGRERANADANRGPALLVGRDGGFGALRIFSGARVELLDASDGGPTYSNGTRVLVGATADAEGEVVIVGGATLAARYVGLGRSAGVDTGIARLSLGGGTVSTDLLEIGRRGTLTNNGLVAGDVVNHGLILGAGVQRGALHNFGVINPGALNQISFPSSTLTLDGRFTHGSGGQLVLDISVDGNGRWITDRLLFEGGQALDFGDMAVHFHFASGRDPADFLAQGLFKIDSFLRRAGANGEEALDARLLGGLRFSADADQFVIHDFSFDLASGARFSATAVVPEPAAWGLLLAGLGGLGGRVRRRGAALPPAHQSI